MTHPKQIELLSAPILVQRENPNITSREKEVLHLVAHEYSSKEIAQKLYISNYTVIAHRQNLMVKMGVKNTAGLVRAGFEIGVLRV